MQIQKKYGEELVTLNVEPDGDGWRVRLPDGSEHRFTAARRVEDVLQISATEVTQTDAETATVGERVFRIPFARSTEGVAFAFEGMAYTFHTPTVRAPERKATAASGALTAPMSGVVADVLVTVGQTVEARQPLVVLEAMKVMTTLEAPFAGTVTALTVQKKQQIAHGAAVVEITPDTVDKDVLAANERE